MSHYEKQYDQLVEHESEQNLQKRIMVALSAHGCLIFRNNVGAVYSTDGRFIKFGVGSRGGSDLIGLTPDGRFLAVEVKRPKQKPTALQIQFMQAVIKQGGVAGVARSVGDALQLISG